MFGADRAGGVLDDRQAVTVGEQGEGVHVGGQADLVHRHDRFGATGDRPLGGGRVEVAGGGIDVGEDRGPAALPDRVGGGDEGERGDDHLVAGADPGDVERELQGGRAVGRRDRLGGAHTGGEGALELFHP